jgi:Protein of unknown function (DUF642)
MLRTLSVLASLSVLACFFAIREAVSAVAGSPVRHAAVSRFTGSQNCPAWPSGSGILSDGDFSQAINPVTVELALRRGTIFAPDWIVTGPKTIDFYGSPGNDWHGIDGLCNVDLDGTPGPSGIQHAAFRTKRHAAYTVTFEFSGNGACGPTVKMMTVSTDGGQFSQFTWDISSGNTVQNGIWAQESWQFSATSKLTTLTFQSNDPKHGNCGPVVAAISVTRN